MSKVGELAKELMNKDQYCNYCRKVTETKKWDCKSCNFSKVHPEELRKLINKEAN